MLRLFVLLALFGASALAQAPVELRADAQALSTIRNASGERGALSMTDGRRSTLARRILKGEPTSALAHDELALRSVLDFEWRKRNAERRGLWNLDRPNSSVRSALRAREVALEHIEAALVSEPSRAGVHRLAARLAVLADDDSALSAASERFLAARPADAFAQLQAGAAAYRNGNLADAQILFERGLGVCRAFRVNGERESAASSARRATVAIVDSTAMSRDKAVGVVRPRAACAGKSDRPLAVLSDEDRAAFGPGLFVRASDRPDRDRDPTSWENRFWEARDPWQLSPENERRLEHYSRLVVADLLFAPSDGRARGWTTDRGETYVRYGEPLGRSWAMTLRNGAAERWTYEGFSLAFEDWFASGDFSFASSATGLDDATQARTFANTIGERSNPHPGGVPIELPLAVSAFRGAKGATEVVLAFAVPLESPSPDVGVVSGLELRAGAFLRDIRTGETHEKVDATSDVAHANLIVQPEGLHWLHAFSLTVSPGDTEAIVEVEQGRTKRRGMVRERMEVRDFETEALAVASLVLALDAGELDAETAVPSGALTRGNVWFRPSPFSTFNPTAPLRLFTEVYNLTLRDERARYSVEARLDPIDQRGRLSRLLRLPGAPQASAVSVSFDAGTDAAEDALLLWLDASNQPDGSYRLTVSVTDAFASETVTVARDVHLSRTF